MPRNKEAIITVFIDGACGPYNPGGYMGWGGIAYNNHTAMFKFSEYAKPSPNNSNNLAEYNALEYVLNALYSHRNDRILIKSDSKMLVCQMNGSWRIKKGAYAECAKRCKDKIKEFSDLKFKWIPRHLNSKADDLSKERLMQAIDMPRTLADKYNISGYY